MFSNTSNIIYDNRGFFSSMAENQHPHGNNDVKGHPYSNKGQQLFWYCN